MTQQADVRWRDLKLDLTLLVSAFVFVGLSLWFDLTHGSHNYFQRSGAVMVLLSGILAYRGLDKYWVKAENSFQRGYWLRTSRNQKIIDGCTLFISIVGTVIWGYGDLIYGQLF